MNTSQTDGFQQYIDGVLDGSIVTNKWIKLAVKRHLKDVKRSADPDFPYRFDKPVADYYIALFPTLFRHYKGACAGQPFELHPWEQFFVGNIFGWRKKADNLRRFKRGFITVSRKNGKTTLLAALADIFMLLDNEPSARVVSAAVARDQAKEVYDAAKQLIKNSPHLRDSVYSYNNRIENPQTDSTFMPLASEANSLEGKDISCAVVDEAAFHPNDSVFQVLNTAMGNRLQPFICLISTAGFNQNSFFLKLQEQMEDMLNGSIELDDWFALIYSLDQKDSYKEEKNWIKANPNLPYVPTMLPELRDQFKLATYNKAALNNFLIKHCNKWVTSAESWLDIDKVDACKSPEPFDPEAFRGRTAYVGFDYAEQIDLSALCLILPPEGEDDKFRYAWKFYLPQQTIQKHTDKGDFRWKNWVASGELTETLGHRTDEAVIRQQLLDWNAQFNIQFVGYDKRFMGRFADELTNNDGLPMVEIPQNYMGLTEATKRFEAQIIGAELVHYGGDLFRWQASNVTLLSNNQGLCMPKRPELQSATRKVDGILAAVTALACHLRVSSTAEYATGVFL